jgi:CRP/FNR family transcriptional regulator, cyclic AMP receptor protein
MDDDAAKLLRQTPLFARLSEGSLSRLAGGAARRSYPKGEILWREGDPGQSLCVIADGLVKISVNSPSGGEMLLATLQSPDAFGELSLVDEGTRSATATAGTDTVVLSLDRSTFLDGLSRNPEAIDALLQTLGSVIRRLTEQASDLVFLDLHSRVAKVLLGFAAQVGTNNAETIELDLPLTQEELGEMVGGSRQSVNQILHEFQRRGILDMHGRRIRILQIEQLQRRALS